MLKQFKKRIFWSRAGLLNLLAWTQWSRNANRISRVPNLPVFIARSIIQLTRYKMRSKNNLKNRKFSKKKKMMTALTTNWFMGSRSRFMARKPSIEWDSIESSCMIACLILSAPLGSGKVWVRTIMLSLSLKKRFTVEHF